MKTCSKCLNELDFSMFHKSLGGKFGLRGECKKCTAQYDRTRKDLKLKRQKISRDTIEYKKKQQVYNAKYRATHDKKYSRSEEGKYKDWVWRLWNSFHMTEQDYYVILEIQQGVCAICKNVCKTGKRLCVDHDHSCCPGVKSCGECIRGLLCRKCNTALGALNDDIGLFHVAIGYLVKGGVMSEQLS